MTKFTDSDSTYQNNSASDGGVYFFDGTGTTASVMTVTNCIYEYNYGAVGGVFALYDYFTVSISDCTFNYNWGGNGGVIYVSEISSTTSYSTLAIKSNDFNNNTASSMGGALYTAHATLVTTLTYSNTFEY